MNKTELLEMALEKLTAASNYIDTLGGVSKGYRMDIERLKAALQAKDEPVAIDSTTMELAESVGLIGPASRTHDLHDAIQRFHDLICANATIKAAVDFSRTLQAKDEPVAWMSEEDDCIFLDKDKPNPMDYDFWTPLYTTPPQRTWIGLTDEEIAEALGDEIDSVYMTDFRRVEARLKEKNT